MSISVRLGHSGFGFSINFFLFGCNEPTPPTSSKDSCFESSSATMSKVLPLASACSCGFVPLAVDFHVTKSRHLWTKKILNMILHCWKQWKLNLTCFKALMFKSEYKMKNSCRYCFLLYFQTFDNDLSDCLLSDDLIQSNAWKGPAGLDSERVTWKYYRNISVLIVKLNLYSVLWTDLFPREQQSAVLSTFSMLAFYR